MKRPVGVTILSVLAIFGGAVLLLSSLGYVAFPTLRTPLLFGAVSGVAPSVVVAAGVFSLIAGVFAIVSGIAALSLKSWAWMTGIVVWATGLAFNIVQMIVTGISLIPVVSGLVAVAILAYLTSASVREALGVQVGQHHTTHHASPA